MSKSKNFKILKFNGKDFVMRKVKICVILVNDECAIALKGRLAKPKRMIDVQFAQKDEIAHTDIFLALEDKILSNVKMMSIIAKEL